MVLKAVSLRTLFLYLSILVELHLINNISKPLLVRFDAFSYVFTQASSQTWTRLCVTASYLKRFGWQDSILISHHMR